MPDSRTTRRWLVISALAVVLFLLILLTPKALGYYLYTFKVRSLQARCLSYSASADEIVYDTDPADRARLLASGRGYRSFNDWAVFRVPTQWHDFRGSYDCPDGTAFLHERTSPSGHQRLVAVDLIPVGKNAVELRGSVVKIAPLFDTKQLEGCRSAKGEAGLTLSAKPPGFLRVFAGQSDPVDASRFVIRADLGSGMVMIACQLRDNDRVEIQLPTEAREGS